MLVSTGVANRTRKKNTDTNAPTAERNLGFESPWKTAHADSSLAYYAPLSMIYLSSVEIRTLTTGAGCLLTAYRFSHRWFEEVHHLLDGQYSYVRHLAH